MGVNPLRLQTVLFDNGRHCSVSDGFVPNSKTGCGATDIGFGEASVVGRESTGANSGVDTDSDLLGAVGEGFSKACKLRNGAVE